MASEHKPNDDELPDDELPEPLDEEQAKKLLDEMVGLPPRKPPLPSHWNDLILAVSFAEARHQGNPDRPLYKIGRFGAIAPRGRGGFGLVFKAQDLELDRHVALKMCLSRGPKAVAAFNREAKLLAKLSHPNVIPVYETGRHGDDVFFVMEYVEGQTGQELIRERLPWRKVVDIYRGAGSGLAAAHDATIIHGDFKPENILIDKQDRPRVADFGLAQIMIDHAPAHEREGLEHRFGTVPYMAPEVLRGQPGDALSDQWSFCVSLWETLEGRRPFMGGSPERLLESIEQGEPWAVRPEAEVPEAVRSVLRVGLSAEPSERYPDMHTLVAELDRLRRPSPLSKLPDPEQVDGETTAAGSKSTKRRLLHRTRQDNPGAARRPWPWIAAAGFGFGVAFALGMVMAVPSAEADACEEVMSELDPIWNNEVRAELRGAFGTRKAGDALMGWTSRWVTVRAQECDAAKLEARATKPSPCSISTRERLEATLHAFRTPHLREGLEVATVIAELPAPEYCLEHPEDGEWGNGGLLELRNIDVEVEALVRMGDLEVAQARHGDYLKLVQELHSDYGFARVAFWNGEILRLEGELEHAAWVFERVYEHAQELEVPVFGAEVLMKLTAIAGAQGKAEVANAHALAARSVFAARRPGRVAELLQVQGLALVSGPERWRARGVALLLRAVELREAQLQEYKGTRELLSQAHESYARGLLAVHRASEALEYLDVALSVHQDEFGHGTWRTRGILRQKFLALMELKRFAGAEPVMRLLLKVDADDEMWRRYIDDTFWLANVYRHAGEAHRARFPLRAGRARATEHGLFDEVARFDVALVEIAE